MVNFLKINKLVYVLCTLLSKTQESEIYIQSARNNSNETIMCLGRTRRFGQHYNLKFKYEI